MYTVQPKVRGRRTITPMCSSIPNCCHKAYDLYIYIYMYMFVSRESVCDREMGVNMV